MQGPAWPFRGQGRREQHACVQVSWEWQGWPTAGDLAERADSPSEQQHLSAMTVFVYSSSSRLACSVSRWGRRGTAWLVWQIASCMRIKCIKHSFKRFAALGDPGGSLARVARPHAAERKARLRRLRMPSVKPGAQGVEGEQGRCLRAGVPHSAPAQHAACFVPLARMSKPDHNTPGGER